jgi:small subunit ribosomal protein S6e
MADEIKCTINNPKDGKSYTKTIEKGVVSGRKIRDTVPGNLFGLTGYELKITGGSDDAGFPMRPEINTAARKKILVQNSIGVKVKKKGMLKRKTVRGNTVNEKTAQLNLVISKAGTKPIQELLAPKKEEQKTEEKK